MAHVTDTAPGTHQRAAPTDPITRWLFMVAALVVGMVLVGGYVRLSRAGLSIVEWDVVTGILPPIGDAAWAESFALYQESPEYRLVNRGMSLGEYQEIFYIEWAHRLIARVVGLLVVIPLLWFMRKGYLSARESLRYWGIVALFGVQGLMGWLMVSSGLRDRPAVSHFRLTIHLLVALALLGIVLWMALDRVRAERTGGAEASPAPRSIGTQLSYGLLAAVVVQIGWGGLVAGLKAGYVSDTWPLMHGRFIPRGMLTTYDPGWTGLFEQVGAHWVHRWFAFAVAALAVALYVAVRSEHPDRPGLRLAANSLVAVLIVQIVLGVSVVIFSVPKWLALAHQGTGVALFCVSLVIVHSVRAQPDLQPVREAAQPSEFVEA